MLLGVRVCVCVCVLQDGPYGILFPSQWYMERNPGLPGFENTPISFQPEVGSVSTPVLRSMRRFLPPESLVPAALPNKLSSKVDPMWDYHKYIPYSTGSYDHIYAYSPTATSSAMGIESLDAEEYCWRAQMVQYEQYRALFEGYILRQWKHYAAVLLWKSQSPWPALRGGLYDYYLDQTGGHWGTRVATDMGTEGAMTSQHRWTACVLYAHVIILYFLQHKQVPPVSFLRLVSLVGSFLSDW